MYLQVVQRFPESSYAGNVPVRVKRINIISLIESDSIANADSAIGKFATDFEGQTVVSGCALWGG